MKGNQDSVKKNETGDSCCSSKTQSACSSKKNENKDSCCSSKTESTCSSKKNEKKDSCCSSSANTSFSKVTVSNLAAVTNKAVLQLSIGGMTCAGCCTRIEKFLEEQPGVLAIALSLLTHKASITFDEGTISAEFIMAAIEKLGFTTKQLFEGGNARIAFNVPSFKRLEALESLPAEAGILSVSSLDVGNSKSQLLIEYDSELTGSRKVFKFLNNSLETTVEVVSDLNGDLDSQNNEVQELLSLLKLSAILTIPIVIIHYIFPTLYADDAKNPFEKYLVSSITYGNFFGLLFATPIQLYVAHPIYESAYSAIRYSRRATMDVLISLSTSIAYFFSVFSIVAAFFVIPGSTVNGTQTFFEVSSMLVTLILFGRFFERQAKAKTSDSISELMKLQAQNAILLEEVKDIPLGSQRESTIDIVMVQRGDYLKVLPGARVPVDGIVYDGESEVDESAITGESVPVVKKKGSNLIGGTVNHYGVLIMKVTKLYSESMLTQIVRLVEEAQNSKPNVQLVADIVASYFTLMIITLTIIVFVVWFSLAETGNIDTMGWSPFAFSIRFAITVLVISCPCAISLAVPTAVMVASGVGAKHGVLFKGGEVLESLSKVDTVVFDKTGTLTNGTLTVVESNAFGDCKPALRAISIKNKSADEGLWTVLAAAEQNSEHPLGRAILTHAKNDFGITSYLPTEDYQVQPGHGVSCKILGAEVLVGSFEWVQKICVEAGYQSDDEESFSQQRFRELSKLGYTVVSVAVNKVNIGMVALRDLPREESRDVIYQLHQMGMKVWMITGDNQGTAEYIAAKVDIPSCCIMSGVLPDGKVAKVKALQSLGHSVCFIGDGINDAPSLAGANVGVAVGAGTDVALETADLILVKDNLLDFLNAMDLAKTTTRRIQWNFFWAFLYNIIMMPIASGALYSFHISIPPAFAGLSELLSSIPVIIFSLLLNLWRAPYTSSSAANQKLIVNDALNGLVDERTPLMAEC